MEYKTQFTYKLGTTVLKANKYDVTCSLEVDGDVDLSKFRELLGFSEDTHIEANDILTSPNKVEINRGLRYITISCNLVNSDNNIDSEGRRGTVISSLPITTTQSLKGTVSHYTNTESHVPIVQPIVQLFYLKFISHSNFKLFFGQSKKKYKVRVTRLVIQ